MARILVIEDDALDMKQIVMLLRNADHSVLCAADAETGVPLARTGQPDVILMDIQLPGMDGLRATDLLKKDPATSAIPVIAVTARIMKNDRHEAIAAGCDAYIAKPYRRLELYQVIDSFLLKRESPTNVAEPSYKTSDERPLLAQAV
jgi:two-component system cell cycle response regulator DivK